MTEGSGHHPEAHLHPELLESWMELREHLADRTDIKNLLFDKVTGLPTTPLLFPQVEEALGNDQEVGVLCLNVVKYSKIEEIYGWQVFDDIMLRIADSLREIVGSTIRETDTVAELMVSGNAFVILLSPPRKRKEIDECDLDMVRERVKKAVCEMLELSVSAAVYQKFGCYFGSSIIRNDDNVRLERLVYQALEEALVESSEMEKRDAIERRARLRKIIDAEEISTLFHPVVRLADRAIIGYEALTRGLSEGEFERPDKLFKVAYDADLVVKLERLCRAKAFAAAEQLAEDLLLFINIEPESVADPELRQIMSTTLLSDLSLSPDRIVLEITERSAIMDFAVFRSTLGYLRTLGFGVAIDDAGAGYASLQCIAEVKPEFVKLDMSLIRDIHDDEVKQHLAETLVLFAQKAKLRLIAEGIETVRELEALLELGVEYGQGYLFAYPGEPFPEIRDF